uniref:Uncharacterized protein n=1 Tax=Triticum urartu TaxID=4572 RepID=A0A8R7QR42_TRIUA
SKILYRQKKCVSKSKKTIFQKSRRKIKENQRGEVRGCNDPPAASSKLAADRTCFDKESLRPSQPSAGPPGRHPGSRFHPASLPPAATVAAPTPSHVGHGRPVRAPPPGSSAYSPTSSQRIPAASWVQQSLLQLLPTWTFSG